MGRKTKSDREHPCLHVWNLHIYQRVGLDGLELPHTLKRNRPRRSAVTSTQLPATTLLKGRRHAALVGPPEAAGPCGEPPPRRNGTGPPPLPSPPSTEGAGQGEAREAMREKPGPGLPAGPLPPPSWRALVPGAAASRGCRSKILGSGSPANGDVKVVVGSPYAGAAIASVFSEPILLDSAVFAELSPIRSARDWTKGSSSGLGQGKAAAASPPAGWLRELPWDPDPDPSRPSPRGRPASPRGGSLSSDTISNWAR